MASYKDHIDGLSVHELEESASSSSSACSTSVAAATPTAAAEAEGSDVRIDVRGGSKKKKKKKKKKKVAAAPMASSSSTSSSSSSLSSSVFTSQKEQSTGSSPPLPLPSSSSSNSNIAQVQHHREQVGARSNRPGATQVTAAAAAGGAAFSNVGEQGISRDIAKAAGVDWGSDPVPARMVELQRRHDALVDIAEAAKLTLHDIKDHNEYLAGLTKQIAKEGEAMKRKFRLATTQAVRSTNPKRAAQHESAANAIQRRQTSFNKEVSMTQTEVDWLKQSPAYSQAMEFLDAHWIKTKHGDYVSKEDLRDDQETTFEDMLAQMKLEEDNQPLREPFDDGEGGLTAEEVAEAIGSTKR